MMHAARVRCCSANMRPEENTDDDLLWLVIVFRHHVLMQGMFAIRAHLQVHAPRTGYMQNALCCLCLPA